MAIGERGHMTGSSKVYRHEYKYPVSDIEAEILKKRLSNIMTIDPHVGPKGKYLITSLYFDDIHNTCFNENENGTDPREKFRIRIYNHQTGRIKLECKRKERSKTLKTSCAISKETVESILRNEEIQEIEGKDPLMRKFIHQQKICKLMPKVIVEYERFPYVYDLGNVRVTFDSNLESSHAVGGFLSGEYLKRPVMPIGKLLLEVKFDEFLPDYIYDALQINNLTQTAFSKYYLCRKLNTIK